jgi:hypothetical protein
VAISRPGIATSACGLLAMKMFEGGIHADMSP